jgi:hypothetical protein
MILLALPQADRCCRRGVQTTDMIIMVWVLYLNSKLDRKFGSPKKGCLRQKSVLGVMRSDCTNLKAILESLHPRAQFSGRSPIGRPQNMLFKTMCVELKCLEIITGITSPGLLLLSYKVAKRRRVQRGPDEVGAQTMLRPNIVTRLVH